MFISLADNRSVRMCSVVIIQNVLLTKSRNTINRLGGIIKRDIFSVSMFQSTYTRHNSLLSKIRD